MDYKAHNCIPTVIAVMIHDCVLHTVGAPLHYWNHSEWQLAFLDSDTQFLCTVYYS